VSLVIAAALGYLIGTFSFARLLGRMVLPGADLTETRYPVAGTDETWTYRGVSATSLLRRAGARWFLAVLVLDAAKAFVPTLAFRLAGDEAAAATVAVAVIAGHVWPMWWRFVGGRGQACLLGALLAIDPLSLVAAVLAGLVVGLVVFTSVYAARNMGPVFLVPWFWATDGVGPWLWFAVAVNVVYWAAVRGDLAEERRARRARGLSAMGYRDRLALAARDFMHEE
jgi:glycerol-3-phosphate acyltransferase PlsY